MSVPLSKKIDEINARLAMFISEMQPALGVEIILTVEQVRMLSQAISQMAPILAAAKTHPQVPEVVAQLQTYKANLRELQPTLERLRLTLLAKRSQLSSGQAQLQAVSRWASALSTTQSL